MASSSSPAPPPSSKGLIDNDLLDEPRLMVFPVILGSGKRLLKPLKLSDARTVGAGVEILTYQRA